MSITNDIIVCFNYFSFLLPPAARAGGFACGAYSPAVIISVRTFLTVMKLRFAHADKKFNHEWNNSTDTFLTVMKLRFVHADKKI